MIADFPSLTFDGEVTIAGECIDLARLDLKLPRLCNLSPIQRVDFWASVLDTPKDARAAIKAAAGRWTAEITYKASVDPAIALERGYHATDSPEHLRELGFSPKQQRMVPTLVVPIHSPDGETVSHQIKPLEPRSGPKYQCPAGEKVVLDVHPRMRDVAKDPSAELWITEGMKKADALTSRGICTVGIIGVWNWAVSGTNSKVPLPCWDHVALEGRTVVVAYDADAKTNANVQEALRRLVKMLEGRGAEPLVVYLPPVSGDGKAGVDDYLAAGGTVEELRASAAPFVSVDVRSERLARNPELRANTQALWSSWRSGEWKGMRGASCRSALKALIQEAERSGKVVDGGVKVKMDWRTLALRAGVSRRTIARCIQTMTETGLLKKDNRGRKKDAAGSFILVTATVTTCHHIGKDGETSLPPLHTGDSLLRFRWHYVKRQWTNEGYEFEYVERMGKIAEHLLETLVSLGGEAATGDLIRAMNRTDRPSQFKKRNISKLEGRNIVETDGDMVRLTEGWRDMVEIWREIGGENEADRLQEERYERERIAYRDHLAGRNKPDEIPEKPPKPEADGEIADLERIPEGMAALVEALDNYLRANPRDAVQPANWLAVTLWAYELTEEKPTREEVREALRLLGADEYRHRLLMEVA